MRCSKSAPALFVTVTNVRSGLPRIISNADLSVVALLASACLPDLFPAVEIDGELYWDGGYGGNPTLWPMIHSGVADDLILVQLVPDRIEQVPTDSLSIRRRVGEIVFHSSLVAEMQAIHAMRTLADTRNAEGGSRGCDFTVSGRRGSNCSSREMASSEREPGFICCTTRASWPAGSS